MELETIDITSSLEIIRIMQSASFNLSSINGSQVACATVTNKGDGRYSIVSSKSFPYDTLNKDSYNTIETNEGFSFVFYNWSYSMFIHGERQEVLSFRADRIIKGNPSVQYHRAFFPKKKVKAIDFLLFESFPLELKSDRKKNYYAFGQIKCSIDGNDFYVYNFDEYLAVECQTLLDFEQFKEDADYILEAIGFFTGVFIHDEVFFFSSDDSCFSSISCVQYNKMTDSIQFESFIIGRESTLNKTVYPNADIYSEKTSIISQAVFNSLLEKLNSPKTDRHRLENILFILFYAGTYSLDTQSICFSALFEAMRRYLETKEPRISKSHECDRTSSDECKSFRNALDGLFSPGEIDYYAKKCFTKRKPNQELLKECFEIYGITLDSDDEEAIKRRDTFLHGAIPTFENVTSLDEQSRYLYALSLRQQALCYILILKIIGYEGYIVNYRKMTKYVMSSMVDKDECMIVI